MHVRVRVCVLTYAKDVEIKREWKTGDENESHGVGTEREREEGGGGDNRNK